MWVVREGYEGLVRGNSQPGQEQVDGTAESQTHPKVDHIESNETAGAAILTAVEKPKKSLQHTHHIPHENLLDNLRFGDGDLLRDGTSEYVGGRTLKGRHIVRVGWDDVHGWFSQVRNVRKKTHKSGFDGHFITHTST